MEATRFTQVDPTTWRLEPSGAMRVPVVIYADESLLSGMDEKVIAQATNVATLPGIVRGSYVMPADFLEEGLSKLGYSCEEFEIDRL